MPQRSAFDAFATFPWTLWVAPSVALLVLVAAFLHRPRGGAPAAPAGPGRGAFLAAVALLVACGVLSFGLKVLNPVVAVAMPLVLLRADLGRRLGQQWGWERSPGSMIEGALAVLDASIVVILLLTLRHMGELGIITSVRESLAVVVPLALAPAMAAALAGEHRSAPAAALYAALLAAAALGPMAASAVPGLTIWNPPDPLTQAEINQPRDLAVAYASIPLTIAGWALLVTLTRLPRPLFPILLFVGGFGAAHLTLSALGLVGVDGVLSPRWFVAAALVGGGLSALPLGPLHRAAVGLLAGAILVGFAGSRVGVDASLYCLALLAVCAAISPPAASRPEARPDGDCLPALALSAALLPLILANLTGAAGVFARDQIDHRQAYNKAGLTLGSETEPGTIAILESNQGIYWGGARFAVLKTAAINEGDARFVDAAIIIDGAQPELARLRAMHPGRMFWVLPEEAVGSDRFDTGASLLGARRLRLTSVASTYFPGEAPVTVAAVAAREATSADLWRHLLVQSGAAYFGVGLIVAVVLVFAGSRADVAVYLGFAACGAVTALYVVLGDAAGLGACLGLAVAGGLLPGRLPAWVPLAAPALAALFRFGPFL